MSQRRNTPRKSTPPTTSTRSTKSSMASATGIPEHVDTTHQSAEDEPLLGAPGDASQRPTQPLWHNLGIGTAVIAQAGIWILTGVIWGDIFSHELALFSAHPLLNSTGLLLITQAILILQPTHTPSQKKRGTYTHAVLNDLGVLALLAGLVVIAYNKISHNGTHFESPHAILGLVTYILFAVQALVGITAYFVPALYGGVAGAKKMYKWHRLSGYTVLVMGFATVGAATYTTFNVNVLHIQLWQVVSASVITLVGVLPRIKKAKLGL